MNTVIVMSGGLDSTTLLHMLVKQEKIDPQTIIPLTFNYGQIAKKESIFAMNNCRQLGTQNIHYADLTEIHSIFDSALTIDTKTRPSRLSVTEDKDINKTVVPLRNGLLLTVASIMATKFGNDTTVYYGAHKSDEHYYPDCRPNFIWAFNRYVASGLGVPYNIKVIAPFVNIRKQDVVKLGQQLKVDFTQTWSCYEDGEKHCGKCHSCHERKKAFKIAEVYDVTEYDN